MPAPLRVDRPRLARLPVLAPLALLTGVVHAASFAPFAWWWLQLIALAAVLLLLWQQPAGTPNLRLFLVAVLFGAGWFATGLSWMFISMHRYGGMPAPMAAVAVVLLAMYLAIYPGLALLLAARTRDVFNTEATGRGAGRLVLAHALRFGAVWMASEWLRGVVLTGFPWLAIGYAHVDGPLAGFAPLIGVYGVSGLAGVLAFVCASIVRDAIARRRPIGAVVLVFVMIGAGMFAAQATFTRPVGRPIDVRLLQGNVPQDLKFVPERIVREMQRYAELVTAGTADLTVLPETAWTVPWDRTPVEIVAQLVQPDSKREPMALGMPMVSPDGQYSNSVALIDRATGAITARYDKHHLVPFGEFIPPGFRWFVRMMNIPLGDFMRGATDQAPFAIAGQRLAFNICYEDLFGEEIIRPLRETGGASILVNISNIAWFGDSHALPQHLAIARMRSLETGRPMLRATNTGLTAAIDARGRVTDRLEPFTVGVLQVKVQGTEGLTPYARLGNWSTLLAALLLLVASLPLQRRRSAH